MQDLRKQSWVIKKHILVKSEIERISEIDTLTGVILNNKKTVSIFQASHFVTREDKLEKAINNNF